MPFLMQPTAVTSPRVMQSEKGDLYMSIEVFDGFGKVLAKVYVKTISCYTDGPEDIDCVYLYDYTKDKDVEMEFDVYNITKRDLYWDALEYFQAEELNYC